MKSEKKRILLCYDFFSPAFRGGGPIQSCTNLVKHLDEEYAFFIYTSDHDLGQRSPLNGITSDTWLPFDNATVFYASEKRLHLKSIYNLIKDVNPAVIYINGLFSFYFMVVPFFSGLLQGKKIVIAPRGMLQAGALNLKRWKKRCFLFFFKWFITNAITWHATDTQEKEDIELHAGKSAEITIAVNIPRAPENQWKARLKKRRELRIVFLSLITEKKNLHLILEALKYMEVPVEFDIYGPIKDEVYWTRCQQLIQNQGHTKYKGVVIPSQVNTILSHYHLFVLPTLGENFGHAIYEAFSAGTPALISPYTPWNDLHELGAGRTVLPDAKRIAEALCDFVDMDQDEFSMLSKSTHHMAIDYYKNNNYTKQYRILFG